MAPTHYPVDNVDTAFMVGDPSRRQPRLFAHSPIRPRRRRPAADARGVRGPDCGLLFHHTVNPRRVNLITSSLIADHARHPAAVSDADVDSLYASWLERFQVTAMECVPVSTVSALPRAGKPWWHPSLNEPLATRDAARERHRKRRTQATLAAWRAASRAFRERVRSAKRAFLTSVADRMSQNVRTAPDQLWKVYNRLTRPRSSGPTPPIVIPDSDDDRCATTAQEKAELLNSFFASVSSSRVAHAESCPQCRPDPDILRYAAAHRVWSADEEAAVADDPIDDADAADFTVEELDNEIASIRGNGAGGIDTVVPPFLKQSNASMRASLLHLMNESWRSGRLPRLWKAANVTPILKPGAKTIAPSSFRPISLLSVVGKLCERLVLRRLVHRVEASGVLPPTQSGFRKLHSTLDCISRLSLAVHDALGSGDGLLAAFVDVEKAYDTVWRTALLVKLHKAGVRGRLFRWLRDFLSGRSQRVLLDGSASSWRTLEDGVPQGSVLSCTLYLVFTCDLLSEPAPAGCSDARFADDVTIWSRCDKASPGRGVAVLQSRLSQLSSWASRSLTHINVSKSVVTLFQRPRVRQRPDAAAPDPPMLFLNGAPLRHDPSPSYLGVRMSSDGRWSLHVSSIATRLRRTLFAMCALVNKLGGNGACTLVMLKLYRSLMQPILDYAAPVWFAAPPRHLAPLEQLQHRALVRAAGAWKSASHRALCGAAGGALVQTAPALGGQDPAAPGTPRAACGVDCERAAAHVVPPLHAVLACLRGRVVCPTGGVVAPPSAIPANGARGRVRASLCLPECQVWGVACP